MVTTVTITGDITNLDGTEPTSARIRFTLSHSARDEVDGELLNAVTLETVADAAGLFSIDVWPNDRAPTDRPTYLFEVLVGSDVVYHQPELFVASVPAETTIHAVIDASALLVKPTSVTFTQTLTAIDGETAIGDTIGTLAADGDYFIDWAVTAGTRYFRAEGAALVLKEVPPVGTYPVTVRARNVVGDETKALAITLAAGGFSVGQWSVADLGDPAGDQARISITALPPGVAAEGTTLEVKIGDAAWAALGLPIVGDHDITVPAFAQTPVLIRVVINGTAGLDSDQKTADTRQVPAAFTAGQWAVAAGLEQADITVTALPAINGAALIDIEGRVDGGAWVSLGGAATGSYTLAAASGAARDIEIRAVNAIGGGDPSDTKTVTPLSGYTATVADFSRSAIVFDSDAARGNNSADIPKSGTTNAPDGHDIHLRLVPREEQYQDGLLRGAASLSAADVKAVMPANAARMIADFRPTDTRALATIAAEKGWTLGTDDFAGTITINGQHADYGDYYDFGQRRVIFADGASLRCAGIRCRNMSVQQNAAGCWVDDMLILQGSGDGIENQTGLVVQVDGTKFFAGQIISGGNMSDGLACGNRMRFGIAYVDCPIQHPDGQAVPAEYNGATTYALHDCVVAVGQSLTGPYHRALVADPQTAPVVGASTADWAYVDAHSDGIQGSPAHVLAEGGILYFNTKPGARVIGRQDATEVVRVNAPISTQGSGHIDLGMIIFEQDMARPAGPRWTINLDATATVSIQTGTVTGPNGGGNFVGGGTIANASIGSVIDEQTGVTLVQSGITVIGSPTPPSYASIYTADTAWAGRRVHGDWQTVGQASGGTWSGTYTGAKRSPFLLEVEVLPAGSVASPGATTAGVAIGHVTVQGGASNTARMYDSFHDLGDPVDISDNTRVAMVISQSPILPANVTDTIYTSATGNCTSAITKYIRTLIDGAPRDFFAIGLDAEPGEGWRNAFNDAQTGRDFGATKALFDHLQADGARIGIIYAEFVSGFQTGPLSQAEALARFCFGKDLAGNPVPELAAGTGFPTVDINTNVNHIFTGLYGSATPVFLLANVAPPKQSATASLVSVDALDVDASETFRAAFPNDVKWGLSDKVAERFTPAVDGGDNHISGRNDGFGRVAKAYAFCTLAAFGKVTPPTFVVEEVTATHIRLSSPQGPITTLERMRNGGAATNFRGGDAEVLGFYGADIPVEWAKTEIRTAAGAPATAGEVWVLPVVGQFDGNSLMYYQPKQTVTFDGDANDFIDGRHKHYPVLDVPGFTALEGIMVQPPIAADFINDQNGLEATLTWTVADGSPDVRSSANMQAIPTGTDAGWTIEATVIRQAGEAINIITGADNNNWTRVFVGTDGQIGVKLAGGGGDLINANTANNAVALGAPVKIRVSIDMTGAGQALIFVEDAQIDTLAFIDNARSHTGNQQARIGRVTNCQFAEVRFWREVAAGGALPGSTPWFHVQAVAGGPPDYQILQAGV